MFDGCNTIEQDQFDMPSLNLGQPNMCLISGLRVDAIDSRFSRAHKALFCLGARLWTECTYLPCCSFPPPHWNVQHHSLRLFPHNYSQLRSVEYLRLTRNFDAKITLYEAHILHADGRHYNVLGS